MKDLVKQQHASLAQNDVVRQSAPSFLILAAGLIWSAFGPMAQAVSPPPDGGYSNGNTAEGTDALFSLTTALDNTAIGLDALHDTTIAGFNTAVGSYALESNTSGAFNTAVGAGALSSSVTAGFNTAVGFDALNSTSTGTANTAAGYLVLWLNTSGTSNTALGTNALGANTTGSRNVAIGSAALISNQTGIDNTATGVNALSANTGNYNTATGYQALESNTAGSNNTAHGLNSLNANTTGNNNTASGAYTLFNNVGGSGNTANGDLGLHENSSGVNNTSLGTNALYGNTIGSTNIGIGFSAGFNLTTGSNNIDIGNLGVAAESSTIRIGTAGTQTATFIAGIKGVPIAGAPVTVGSTGQLGIRTSSKRFKHEIRAMAESSEAIYGLEPVIFRYKPELDPDEILQFGLLAEEVAKVDPVLVDRDEAGKPYSVRYEAVNAMLLNEFLKEHRKGQEQDARIKQQSEAMTKLESAFTQQQKEIVTLTETLKEQAIQIGKMAAHSNGDNSKQDLIVSDQ